MLRWSLSWRQRLLSWTQLHTRSSDLKASNAAPFRHRSAEIWAAPYKHSLETWGNATPMGSFHSLPRRRPNKLNGG
jgi:hypothetical protein